MSFKRSYVLLEAEVWCNNCDWKCTSNNAQAVGKLHAKKYGHKVIGTLAHTFGYDFTATNANQQTAPSKNKT